MKSNLELDYALMAGAAYVSTRNRINQIPVPDGWSPFSGGQSIDHRVGSEGFEAAVFQKNGNSNEVVISFAGTDPSSLYDLLADATLYLGFMSSQLEQAARYYLDVKLANPNAEVTFTGHSLGGGLAALLGLLFDEPAWAFDQGPFKAAATIDMAIDLHSYLLAEGYAGSPPLNALSVIVEEYEVYEFPFPDNNNGGEISQTVVDRAAEGLVRNTSVAGQFLDVFSAAMFGDPNPIQHGAVDAHPINILHSQALLIAFVQSKKLLDATYSLDYLLQDIFDETYFAANTATDSPDMLSNLVRYEFGSAGDVASTKLGLLTKFGNDAGKIATFAGAGDIITQPLFKIMMNYYYVNFEPIVTIGEAPGEFFMRVDGGLQFDLTKSFDGMTLSEISGYSDLEVWISVHVPEGLVDDQIYDYLADRRRITLGLDDTLSARIYNDVLDDFILGGSAASQILGGGGDDFLVGVSGSDYLNGGIGSDSLVGGGNDTLEGGSGDDNFFITNANATVIKSAEGRGSIWIVGAGTSIGSGLIRVEDVSSLETWIDGNGIEYQFSSIGMSSIGTLKITGDVVGGEIAIQNFDLMQAQNNPDGYLGIRLPKDVALMAGVSKGGFGSFGGVGTDPIALASGSGQMITLALDCAAYEGQAVILKLNGGNSSDYAVSTGAYLLQFDGGELMLAVPAGSRSVSFMLVNTNPIANAATLSLTASLLGSDPEVVAAASNVLTVDVSAGSANPVVAPPDIDTVITGGLGLAGHPSDVTVYLGSGNSLMVLNGEKNIAFGAAGDDSIVGSLGRDTIQAGGGNNAIEGHGGGDNIFVDDGANVIFTNSAATPGGSDGIDAQVLLGGGNNTVTGGEEVDLIVAGSPVGADVDIYDFHLWSGGGGNNVISGGGGRDVIYAGNGNNQIYAATQTDIATAITNAQTGAASGLAGGTILVGDGDNTIVGGSDGVLGTSLAVSDSGQQILVGRGDNLIVGGAGSHLIVGGAVALGRYGSAGDFSTLGVTITGDENYDVPADYEGVTLRVSENGRYFLGFGADSLAEPGTVAVGTGNNTIFGGAGDSKIYLSNGNNYVDAGGGDDLIVGGMGRDTIFGSSGNITVRGGGGDTFIDGESGDSILVGGGGNNTIFGGSGDSLIFAGGDGDDWASSATGNNYVYAGSGRVTILGGGGDDTLVGGSGIDLIMGGAGNTLIFTGDGGNANQATEVIAGSGNTTIQGGLGNAHIWGGSGENLIYIGDGGTDGAPTIVELGTGNSTVHGGLGVGLIIGGSGNSVIHTGDGGTTETATQVQLGSGDATVYGGYGVAQVIGGTGDVVLHAGNGDTTLQGGSGHNTLVAGSGNSVLINGSGDTVDVINAGFGQVSIVDTDGSVQMQFGPGIDVDDLDVALALDGNGIGSLQIVGSGIIQIDGGLRGITDSTLEFVDGPTLNLSQFIAMQEEWSDSVAGIDGDVQLSTIEGDVLTGGTGNDQLLSWGDNSTLYAGSGNQHLVAYGDAALLVGGSGSDTLSGGFGNDTLVGGDGFARMEGGMGSNHYRLQQDARAEIISGTDSGIETIELPEGSTLSNLLALRSGQDLLLYSATGSATALVKDFYVAQPAGRQWLLLDSVGGAPQSLTEWLEQSAPTAASYTRTVTQAQRVFEVEQHETLMTYGANGAGTANWSTPPGRYMFGGVETRTLAAEAGSVLYASSSESFESNWYSETRTYTQQVPVYALVTRPNMFGTGFGGLVDGVWVGADPFYSSYEQIGTVNKTFTQNVSLEAVTASLFINRVVGNDGNNTIIAGGSFTGFVELGDGDNIVRLGAGRAPQLFEQDWYDDWGIGYGGQLQTGMPGAFVRGGDGANEIVGTTADDVLVAGTGFNLLAGGAGADTYFVPLRGVASSLIYDAEQASATSTNTLVLPPGITPEDIGFRLLDDPHYPHSDVLELAVGNSSVRIVTGSYYVDYISDTLIQGIQHFQFADGTILTQAQLLVRATPLANDFAPTVSADDFTLAANQSIAAGDFVAAADVNGNQITWYKFFSRDDNAGYFTVDDVRQAANKAIYVKASELDSVRYVAGNPSATGSVDVSVFDGAIWSSVEAAQVAILVTKTYTNVYDANGVLVSDTWTGDDGSSGYDNYFADGVSYSTIYYPNGDSDQFMREDGFELIKLETRSVNGRTVEELSYLGIKTSANWTASDGSFGTDLFAGDGSTVQKVTGDWGTETHIRDAQGTGESFAVYDGGFTSIAFYVENVLVRDDWVDPSVQQFGFNTLNDDGTGTGIICDLDGRVVATSTRDPSSGEEMMVEYTYTFDATGATWTASDGGYGSDITAADGTVAGFGYNQDGSLRWIYTVDINGYSHTEFYDGTRVTGDISSSTDGEFGSNAFNADGSASGTYRSADNKILTYTIDAAGNRVVYADIGGNTTIKTYDAGGQLVADSYVDESGSSGQNTYNADGSSSGIDWMPDGIRTYTQDADGNRHTEVTTPGNFYFELSDFDAATGVTTSSWTKQDGSYGERIESPQSTITQTRWSDGSVEEQVQVGEVASYMLHGPTDLAELTFENGEVHFEIARGSGAVRIDAGDDATLSELQYAGDIHADQLWFRRNGFDLEIDVIGTEDSEIISNWYIDSTYRPDQIESGDGKILLASQVDNLVSAMAAFTPPGAGETSIPAAYQTDLAPVLAASWS